MVFYFSFFLQLFPTSVKKDMQMKDGLGEVKSEKGWELGLRFSRGNNWSLFDDCWIVQVVLFILTPLLVLLLCLFVVFFFL